MEYFFADYNWIENQISSYESALNALGVTHVCYMSRGGMFPALLPRISSALVKSIPFFMIGNQERSLSLTKHLLVHTSLCFYVRTNAARAIPCRTALRMLSE